MALVEDTLLSKTEKEVIDFIVDSIPTADLVIFAKTTSSSTFNKGGFRSDKPQIVKSFLKREIDSSHPIDSKIRVFLSCNCECASIIQLLSQSAIEECARAFEILYTKPVFRVARLLDSREDIRVKAAKEQISEDKREYNDDDKKWARDFIAKSLAHLLNAFPASADDSAPQITEADFHVKKELANLRAEAKQLKGAQSRISQLEERLSVITENVKQLTERSEKAEQALGAMRNRAEIAEAATERYRKNIEDYTNASVESRLAEEFSKWLGGKRLEQIRAVFPGDLSSDVPPSDSDDSFSKIVRQAENALRLQADKDISSGVRDILTSQLEKTNALLSKCLAAQKNAISVVPELSEAIKKLTEEKSKLQSVLEEHGPESPAVLSPEDAIDTAITAADDKQLPDITHTTNKLLQIGALSEEAHARLTRKITARYEAYYEKRVGTVLDSGDRASPEEILELGKAGKIPVVLLVDGHNVLYSLTSRYCRAQDHRGPSAEARKWLVDDICQMFGNSPSVRVKLVFDGSEYSFSAVTDNITVEYSGGGTSDVEHRADGVLAQAARSHYESGCGSHLLIVTNDTGLANRVISCGGHSVAPTVFLKWL